MDANGDFGSKRKRSAVAGAGAVERPAKHLKPEGSVLTPGDSTPANGTVYDVEEEEDDSGLLLPLGPPQADSPEWQATIESVVKSVVSIHFCQTCSFDTELSMSSQATGFVVDAERGYILTNRHVVGAGPFWGYCIFDNHEEVNRPIVGTLQIVNQILTVLDLHSAMSSPSIETPYMISVSSNSTRKPFAT